MKKNELRARQWIAINLILTFSADQHFHLLHTKCNMGYNIRQHTIWINLAEPEWFCYYTTAKMASFCTPLRWNFQKFKYIPVWHMIIIVKILLLMYLIFHMEYILVPLYIKFLWENNYSNRQRVGVNLKLFPYI